MNRLSMKLVPCLALLGAATFSTAVFSPAFFSPAQLSAVELSTALGSRSNDQYLQGSVLFEWILQDNYSGDNDAHDQFWLRAELGTKIELEDHMELNIVFAYDGEFGDSSEVTGGNGSNDGEVVLDEGSILFKKFLRPELDVRFGRQPVNWNLRSGFGAFLYDSRANKPDVMSWDGIVANYDIDNMILRPYMYQLDENNESAGITPAVGNDRQDNTLYGVVIDYEPQHEGDNNIFVTMNFSWEKNVYVDSTTIGNNLATYYIGTEWNMPSGIDIYGEYAKQEGELDSSSDFDGYGYSVGFNSTASDNTLFGVQYDFLSGDDASDTDFGGLVAPHEGVSDLLIFEHERYGEISELFVGNLESIKARFEWALTADERVNFSFVAASYELNKPSTGNSSKLGEEYDFVLDWDYDSRTTLKFFGGFFDPDQGYVDVVGNNKKIQVYGMSIEALF